MKKKKLPKILKNLNNLALFSTARQMKAEWIMGQIIIRDVDRKRSLLGVFLNVSVFYIKRYFYKTEKWWITYKAYETQLFDNVTFISVVHSGL